jgi:Cof subfamily protein (haloacid dehalogenase superfamily)
MGLKMKDFSLSGILLVSDLDGTLVTDKGVIPARNIAAIERFIKKGGRFTFATGRSVMGTLKFTDMVMPNAPIITYNGGCIYDLEKQATLWNMFLPPSSGQIIQEIRRNFPDVGIEVYSSQYVYAVNRNKHTKAHISFGNLSEFERTVDEIPENLNKILFSCDSDRLLEVSEHLHTIGRSGCVYVLSAPIYLEVLPDSVSKGSAVQILADMLGIPHGAILAIGDYYNDRELLKSAAVGAVPADAPEDMKQSADLVVGPCEDGAVADFIEYIEAKYE